MASYSHMTKDELLDEADRQGVQVPEGATNAEIIERLQPEEQPEERPSNPFVNTAREGKFQKHQEGGDGGSAEVQAAMDEATAKGYFGYSPDPTPRANYGALNNDAPTPETDPDMRRAVRDAAGLNQ